jgi:hypothetical protein
MTSNAGRWLSMGISCCLVRRENWEEDGYSFLTWRHEEISTGMDALRPLLFFGLAPCHCDEGSEEAIFSYPSPGSSCARTTLSHKGARGKAAVHEYTKEGTNKRSEA